jgi:hypothetical protein
MHCPIALTACLSCDTIVPELEETIAALVRELARVTEQRDRLLEMGVQISTILNTHGQK